MCGLLLSEETITNHMYGNIEFETTFELGRSTISVLELTVGLF